MSALRKTGDALELGGLPRVHLLPPEIEGQRKARAFRQSLLLGLAGAVVVAIVGVAGVSLLLAGTMTAQQQEQAQGLLLATQIKKYSSVTGVQTQVDAITAAQPIAVDGEILWQPFIASLQATLPAGTAITNFIAKLDSAPADPGVTATPLQGDHVATLSVTAVGSQDALTAWLSQLGSLKGVVTAIPGDISVSTEGGIYIANVDLLLGTDVVADRFKAGK